MNIKQFSLNFSIKHNFLRKSLKRLRSGNLNKSGGRSKYGFILAFKKSKTPYKKIITFIDYWRRTVNHYCYVINIKYESRKTAFIALVCYLNGFITYILHTHNVYIGAKLYVNTNIRFNVGSLKITNRKNIFNVSNDLGLGDTTNLKYMSVGSIISAVELWNNKGIQLCRSAGTSAIIIKKESNSVWLKLRSGWKILVSGDCIATLGIISNVNHKYTILRKAGLNRNLGRKQTVRGVAMNAVDHPHGGGRGKSSGKVASLSPWGKKMKCLSKIKINKKLFRYK